MPRNPHLRFLIRGSLLLIAMLTLWWFALRPPLLFVLRNAEEAALGFMDASITVDDSADWIFQVPVEDVHEESGRLVKVHNIDFTMPRDDVVLFTFSWPVFWALMLAAPELKSNWRGLLIGTAVLALVEPALLFIFAEINTHSVLAQWHPANKIGAAAWWREFGTYVNNGVMPFFVPIALAVGLHPSLRSLVFGATKIENESPAEKRKR